MSRFHADPNERIDIYEFEPSEVISDTPPNVITIRARMNVEIAGRVRSELSKRNAEMHTEGQSGEAAVALLLHNVLGWSGPDFDDLPCTPENIRSLPPVELDAFIEKVVNEIGERNAKRESPNDRSPAMSSTSGNAGDQGSTANTALEAERDHRSGNGILKLHSPSAAILRQSRSEDSTQIS